MNPAQTTVPMTALTRGPKHHWFGYYDKHVEDVNGRYVLALRADFCDRPNTAHDNAEVGVIDTQRDGAWRTLDTTAAWCWQQGNMLQWLPTHDAHADATIIYNRFDDGRYVSVMRDVDNDSSSNSERVIPWPVYAVTHDGRRAATLSFERVNDTRPGYGYKCLPDSNAIHKAPDDDGVFLVDLETGTRDLIVSLAQLASLDADDSMRDAKHWVNHLIWNTDDTRISFLHRWESATHGFATRAFAVNPDGSNLHMLNGPPMTSHFDWRDATTFLAWATHQGADDYWLFTDGTGDVQPLARGTFETDGHCSYSPCRHWILTDTYPDKRHLRTLMLYDTQSRSRYDIGWLYSPPELTDETRVDLHPRWSRDGRHVCIDSAHDGTRQMYLLDVSGIVG